MGHSRFIPATIAGGVVSFLLGGLFYVVLLTGFFEANTLVPEVVKEQPIFWALGLGELVFAAFLTQVMVWKGDSGWLAGMKTGLVVWLLVGLAFAFEYYGVYRLGTGLAHVVDVGVSVVRGAIVGAVIGMVLGSGAGGAAEAASAADVPAM